MRFIIALAKVRRAIKAVKPRRMMRVENKHIVFSACNYATTALITREGEVFMFGKDAYYCDAATGWFDVCLLNIQFYKCKLDFLISNGFMT